jgi:starch synthase (maltosyl-transferring)
MSKASEKRPDRVVIEAVKPEIDGGRFPAKRAVGEEVVVEADVFLEGADSLEAALLYRHESEKRWSQVSMESLGNDGFRGSFTVTRLGRYLYTLRAWPAPFESWRKFVQKKLDAGQDISLELPTGTALVRQCVARAKGEERKALQELVGQITSASLSVEEKTERILDPAMAQRVAGYPDRDSVVEYAKKLEIAVDPIRARFSAWYEMFPRSYGTLRDCEAHLQYVVDLGFDVVYLPPVHPIGQTKRKGKNNALVCTPDDPGSPWAIGDRTGGHKAVHPELGTLQDFRRFVKSAGELGIDVALDIAFQCSPDHPWVEQHPDWFKQRSDGSIRFAENPPKKYEDIYPIDFECDDWQALWAELESVFEFWAEQGVRIFRVDNPHTKPFTFWERTIGNLKRRHPDLIFLAEAFTRPKIMYRLAKLGFTQSYTYFTWRNARRELEEYFTELTQTDVGEFFRPNLWPNTPDILHEYLQTGGRPAFLVRMVLASTLGASWGIYGAAFELCERVPREPGSEEYLNSEKYEIKRWELDRKESLRKEITRINQIRRDNPALQTNTGLRFHGTDNESLICYSKTTPDGDNAVLVVVNLDPRHTQSGWTDLSLEALGLTDNESFRVHDLLSDARYNWSGKRNYLELDPATMPAHLFRIERDHGADADSPAPA